jgi:hypothetical protein
MNQKNNVANFLVIANKRCGSSWLNYNLADHPEVFMTKSKGVHFFDNNYEKGIPFYAEYFCGANNEKCLGETEHSYFWHDKVPERIFMTLGVIPMILSLRQPVERAYSHFQLIRRNRPQGDFSYDFETSFRAAMEAASAEVTWGFYGQQLKKYLEWFPIETFYIIKFEQIGDEPIETIQGAYRFLGVDPRFTSLRISNVNTPATNVPQGTNRLVNKILYTSRPARMSRKVLRKIGFRNIKDYRRFSPPPLDVSLKKKLTAEFFDDDIRLLMGLTDMDFSSWLSDSMGIVA